MYKLLLKMLLILFILIAANAHSINEQVEFSGQAEINILFVYTNTANTLYGGNAQKRITELIDTSNKIFSDSLVKITLQTAGFLEVDFPDSYSAPDALHLLTTADHPKFLDVLNQRYLLGADLVVLLRPSSASQVGGFSWNNGSSGDISSFSELMFSYVSIDAEDFVLAHEIGHNLGLSHSRKQQPGKGFSFDFASGYGINESFFTIMAHGETYDSDNRIYLFSNPSLTCENQACGVSQTNALNGANAAYALNLIRFQAQDLLRDSPDLTRLNDSLIKIKDGNLKQCIENSFDLKRYQYSGLLSKLICNNGAIENINQLEDIFNLHTLELKSNSIQTIAALKFLPRLINLELNDNNISDVSPILNKRKSWLTLNLNNNPIYCWQINYIKLFESVTNFIAPLTCDKSQEHLDFDKDGISNNDEILQKSNPLINNKDAGAISFSRDLFAFKENEQEVTIPLIRIGGTNGPITAKLSIETESASISEDFVQPDINIEFAAGQQSSHIKLQLIDDEFSEEVERVSFTLTNNQESSDQKISKVIIEIIDNDNVSFVDAEQLNSTDSKGTGKDVGSKIRKESGSGTSHYFNLFFIVLILLRRLQPEYFNANNKL